MRPRAGAVTACLPHGLPLRPSARSLEYGTQGTPPQEQRTQDRPHGSPGTQVPWDPGELVPRVTGGMFAPPSMLFSDPRLRLAPFRSTPGAPRPSPVRPPVPLPLVARRASSQGAACLDSQSRECPGDAGGHGGLPAPSELEAGYGRAGVRSGPGVPGPSPEAGSRCSSASPKDSLLQRRVCSTVGHLVRSRTPHADVTQILTLVLSADKRSHVWKGPSAWSEGPASPAPEPSRATLPAAEFESGGQR